MMDFINQYVWEIIPIWTSVRFCHLVKGKVTEIQISINVEKMLDKTPGVVVPKCDLEDCDGIVKPGNCLFIIV